MTGKQAPKERPFLSPPALRHAAQSLSRHPPRPALTWGSPSRPACWSEVLDGASCGGEERVRESGRRGAGRAESEKKRPVFFFFLVAAAVNFFPFSKKDAPHRRRPGRLLQEKSKNVRMCQCACVYVVDAHRPSSPPLTLQTPTKTQRPPMPPSLPSFVRFWLSAGCCLASSLLRDRVAFRRSIVGVHGAWGSLRGAVSSTPPRRRVGASTGSVCVSALRRGTTERGKG